MLSVGFGLQDLQIALLMFARLSAFLSVAPIFGHFAVPVQLRTLLAGFIAVAFLIAGMGGDINVPAPFGMFLLLMVKEAGFGLLIGFLATLIFTGIGMAAQLVGLQSSFGFTSVLDPLSRERGTIIDQLYLLLAALVFLAVDGHHALLRAIHRSYELVPVGEFVLQTGPDGDMLLNAIIGATSAMFEITLRIALPILVPLFITDLAMAIVARTMPQMPVFLIGAPAKILIALTLLVITLPALLTSMTRVFTQVFMLIMQSMRVSVAG
jgi:flagellar biosynthetic protein FliR